MPQTVAKGFPRFKTSKRPDNRGQLSKGDHYCYCGSGRLSFYLYDHRDQLFNSGCTLCAPGKHLVRAQQIENESH